MDEGKIMILLTVWANVVATIALIVEIRNGKKKTAPQHRKRKRKR